jgi:uncharacterized protein YbjQ (UPF0145 family)
MLAQTSQPALNTALDLVWEYAALARQHWVLLLVGLVALWLLMRWRRARRARRPAALHPNLQKYAGDSPAETARRRELAGRILATSSTGQVAGYEIVRQIDAVFEDGHRTPGDAVASLKATAAERGANAVVNLSQERTAAGRCTARGDAVVIRPTLPGAAPPPPAAPDPTP